MTFLALSDFNDNYFDVVLWRLNKIKFTITIFTNFTIGDNGIGNENWFITSLDNKKIMTEIV